MTVIILMDCCLLMAFRLTSLIIHRNLLVFLSIRHAGAEQHHNGYCNRGHVGGGAMTMTMTTTLRAAAVEELFHISLGCISFLGMLRVVSCLLSSRTHPLSGSEVDWMCVSNSATWFNAILLSPIQSCQRSEGQNGGSDFLEWNATVEWRPTSHCDLLYIQCTQPLRIISKVYQETFLIIMRFKKKKSVQGKVTSLYVVVKWAPNQIT